MRVDLRQGEVTEREARLLQEGADHFLDDWVGLAAVGALEIAVLDQRDRGCGSPDHVVAPRRDRYREHRFVLRHGGLLLAERVHRAATPRPPRGSPLRARRTTSGR